MYKDLIEFKKVALSNDLLPNKNNKPNLYDLKVVFDDETKLVSVDNNVDSEKMFNSTYVYDSSSTFNPSVTGISSDGCLDSINLDEIEGDESNSRYWYNLCNIELYESYQDTTQELLAIKKHLESKLPFRK